MKKLSFAVVIFVFLLSACGGAMANPPTATNPPNTTNPPTATNPPVFEGPVAAGEWVAATDFGRLVFTVDATGTMINKVSYQFSNWTCGNIPSSVRKIKAATVDAGKGSEWQITNGNFSIFNYISYNKQDMTFSGSYDAGNQKFSGKWEETSYGTKCYGTWEAIAPK
jgi:hypothetical protein